MRALQRLHVPTLIFVNKIDRPGASYEPVLQAISERLTPALIPVGSARDLGTRAANFTTWGAADAAFAARLASALAERNDAILAAYVDDETSVSYSRLREELAAQTKKALVHPVFFGSAITGAGVDALIAGIAELLPAAEGHADGPLSGTVFKVERGVAGERIAWVRVFSGTLRTRERPLFRGDHDGKVTAIRVFDHGRAVRRSSVVAGQIAQVWGLAEIQIGDAIGLPRTTADHGLFGPPTLETVVVPRSRGDKGALHAALVQLAEQDPLINLGQNDDRQELIVSLYGEVQKEVIQETLANDFDIEVEFRETTPVCIERPIGSGAAVEKLSAASNPFLATIGLRIEPAPINTGVELRLQVGVRSIPLYVYKTVENFGRALEETVRTTLRQGLYGWQVTDCTVTMTDCGYSSPSSTAGDFRKLTPLVLMRALERAGTEVCEPLVRVSLEIPTDTVGAVLSVLARLGAVQTPSLRGELSTIETVLPAARVQNLQRQLPALTGGEGVLESDFGGYQPVSGAAPTRRRTTANPLNREEYMMHLARRAIGTTNKLRETSE